MYHRALRESSAGTGFSSLFFVVFDERDEAVLAEVLARVEEDQDDDYGVRSDGIGRIVEPAEAVVGCQAGRDHDPDDREREKQLLAPKRALDEALLSVRRQFAPPSVDSGFA